MHVKVFEGVSPMKSDWQTMTDKLATVVSQSSMNSRLETFSQHSNIYIFVWQNVKIVVISQARAGPCFV